MNENNETQVNETNTKIEGQEKEKETAAKTYTQEEVDALLQKEGDRRISMYQKKLDKEKREAEKLHSMNEEEKREYLLTKREQELNDKEVMLQRLENKSEGLSILAEKGLDPTFIDFVLADDAESMYNNIKTIEKAFKKSVKAEVEKRIANPTPKKTGSSAASLDKKAIANMSLSELQAMYNEDPDVFK